MTRKFDLIIIGAGSGGLTLAASAAQLGLKVAVIEAHKMGGDCLNYGCVPSKALLAAAKKIYHAKTTAVDFSKVMQQVQKVISKLAPHDSVARFEALGVEVFLQTAQFIDKFTIKAHHNILKAKKIVIASGSKAFIPAIEGLAKTKYLTNETIFNLAKLPEHLIIIGGGPIGCELSQAFAMLGSKVTIIEASKILAKDDSQCVAILKDSFKDMKIKILENTQVLKVSQNYQFDVTTDDNQNISGSHLLVATGRRPNINDLKLQNANIEFTKLGIKVDKRLRTKQKHIFALGDVIGQYQFTHAASYHAGIVLRNIAFRLPAKVKYNALPWVTYTYPEMASVGILPENTKNLITTTWDFENSDRAQAELETSGMIKVTTNKRGKILAVTIVNIHAGELILPWVMAINDNKSLRYFTNMIVAYPTLSEASKQVAGEFYKEKLFSKKVRTLVAWLQKF